MTTETVRYDFTTEQLDAARDAAIRAAREALGGLEIVHSFDDNESPAANAVDIWLRTPNGWRTVVSVAVWSPYETDEDDDAD